MSWNGWTRENARHVLAMLWRGHNPAARVYESIGTDFFLAPAPGWLNLGLWEGPGDEQEAAVAVHRLVERVADELPAGADVLDVGNGLGAQDPVIAAVARPGRLDAPNITQSQPRPGRGRLAEAPAQPVCGDAAWLPFANASFDGVISVEAAFHFSSRAAFFREVRRVLRPGGVITMSDVPAERMPRSPMELVAGFTQLRLWGMRAGAAMSATEIVSAARGAGLQNVRVDLCGERVIDPALAWARRRLQRAGHAAPGSQVATAKVFLNQVELLRSRGILDYLFLSATAPE